MITYCNTSAAKTIKLCSISNEIFTIEYYVLLEASELYMFGILPP